MKNITFPKLSISWGIAFIISLSFSPVFNGGNIFQVAIATNILAAMAVYMLISVIVSLCLGAGKNYDEVPVWIYSLLGFASMAAMIYIFIAYEEYLTLQQKYWSYSSLGLMIAHLISLFIMSKKQPGSK